MIKITSKKKVCRFEIQDLLPIGFALIVAGVGIAYGLSVVSDVREDMCVGTNEHYSTTTSQCYTCSDTSPYFVGDGICSNETIGGTSAANVTVGTGGSAQVNASTDAMSAIAKIPAKMPLIVTVIIAAIIIGILVRYLMVRFN